VGQSKGGVLCCFARPDAGNSVSILSTLR
jgi:hypothetical protein